MNSPSASAASITSLAERKITQTSWATPDPAFEEIRDLENVAKIRWGKDLLGMIEKPTKGILPGLETEHLPANRPRHSKVLVSPQEAT